MRSRTDLRALVVAAGLSVILTACATSGGATPGPTALSTPAATPAPTSAPTPLPPTPIPSFDGPVIDLVAVGREYGSSRIEAAAGTPFRILLDNQDAGTAHDVNLGSGATADEARAGTLVFDGEVMRGPGLQAYDVGALPTGSYWFFCQVHLGMNGALTIN